MKNMFTRATQIFALSTALVCGGAQAALVTFEGFGANTIIGDENTGNGLQSVLSGGYSLTSSGDHFHLGSGLFGVPSNGTGILLQDRNYAVTMTKVGGGAFDLLGADLGEDVSFGASAMSIEITGFFSGGGSISTIFVLDGNASSFQNNLFAGFTNLSSVMFDGIGNPITGDEANGFTLDNISVVDAAAVPEPGSLALLGLGLAGLAAVRRRKA